VARRFFTGDDWMAQLISLFRHQVAPEATTIPDDTYTILIETNLISRDRCIVAQIVEIRDSAFCGVVQTKDHRVATLY
jgi:hypothetical protein